MKTFIRYPEVLNKYIHIHSNYPLSFDYLYLYLMSKEYDSERVIQMRIDELKKNSLKVYLYSFYLKLITSFYKIKINICYMQLGRSESVFLNKRIVRNKFVRYVNSLLLRNIQIDLILKGSFTLNKAVSKIDFDNFDNNSDIEFAFLENELIKQREYFSRKIKKINAIVFCDSAGPHVLFLLSFLRKKCNEVVCIPHGYYQDYSNVYNFARFSTIFLCWSKKDKQVINELLPNINTIELGCPRYSETFLKSFRKNKKNNIIKQIVFFLPPVLV